MSPPSQRTSQTEELCVTCAYWNPWPNQSVGRCNSIFSDHNGQWLPPTQTCNQQSTDYDPTLNDMEQVACLIKR